MTENSPRSQETPAAGLETRMQKVSRALSVVGMGLMCSGFIEMVSNESTHFFTLPGAAVLPLRAFIDLQTSSPGLILTSTGVILLCLLPAVRVIMALWLYLRMRDLFSALIAVIVFLELLVSIRMSA